MIGDRAAIIRRARRSPRTHLPIAMKTALLLTILPLAAACSMPKHKATRTYEVTLPAAGLQRLVCETRNGDITIVGDAAATTLSVRADLSVRGHTQAEADANLKLLDVQKDVGADAVTLTGLFPAKGLGNCSPEIAFTIRMPTRLRVAATTHNGDVRVDGSDGGATLSTHNGDVVVAGGGAEVQATSHNGDVDWQGAGRRVELTTHNGDVRAAFATAGEVQSTLTSHNGDVDLTFPGAVDAAFAAETSNGGVRLAAKGMTDVVVGRGGRSATARLGKGGAGQVKAVTHNGDVTAK